MTSTDGIPTDVCPFDATFLTRGAAQNIDHGIGARTGRQCDLQRRILVEHRMWPLKEAAHLGFVAENIEREREHLRDARQTVALVGGQRLLFAAQRLSICAISDHRQLARVGRVTAGVSIPMSMERPQT